VLYDGTSLFAFVKLANISVMILKCFQAQGRVILNHPLDVHYSTTALEGWPVIVLEVLLHHASIMIQILLSNVAYVRLQIQ
jgi:hypothetical protein